MSPEPSLSTPSSSAARTAALQIFILAVLCVLTFTRAFADTFRWAEWNPEAAHAYAAPVVIAVLFLLRRRDLAEAVGPGSWLGLVLLVVSLLGHFLVSWPFNYGLPRRLAVVPALAGAVLAVGGWRLFWRAAPLLLLVAIAIPSGTRYYARVIVLPETLTLAAAKATLDVLPGVLVERDGLDLSYVRGAGEGSIAKGVSNRGASMLMASLMVWVFVTFARVRPRWQVVAAFIAAGPIVLLCNYLRVVAWGVMTIYSGASPVNQWPRYGSTVVSLLLAWLLTAALFWVLDHLAETTPEPVGPAETEGA